MYIFSIMFTAGEHEDEGDYRKGAQSQAPPDGLPQSPKSKVSSPSRVFNKREN